MDTEPGRTREVPGWEAAPPGWSELRSLTVGGDGIRSPIGTPRRRHGTATSPSSGGPEDPESGLQGVSPACLTQPSVGPAANWSIEQSSGRQRQPPGQPAGAPARRVSD